MNEDAERMTLWDWTVWAHTECWPCAFACIVVELLFILTLIDLTRS